MTSTFAHRASLRGLTVVLVVVGSVVLRAAAQSQDQAATDQQAVAAQMQQMRQQVVANMQAKGIDPRQFFQQMMQDGSFDPAEMQQKLLDQGLIDKASLDQMRGAVQKAVASGLRQQLKATDDEWAVLQPKIQRVIDAQASLGQGGQLGAGGGGRLGGLAAFAQSAKPDDASAKASRELKTAVHDPKATDEAVTEKLAAWRAAHEQAKAELAAARQDLTAVLTVKQEGILTAAGLL